MGIEDVGLAMIAASGQELVLEGLDCFPCLCDGLMEESFLGLELFGLDRPSLWLFETATFEVKFSSGNTA